MAQNTTQPTKEKNKAAIFFGWLLFVIMLILVALDIYYLVVVNKGMGRNVGYGFRGATLLSVGPFGLVGFLITRQQPKNIIGWLFLAAGISGVITEICMEHFRYSYFNDLSLANEGLAALTAQWLWLPPGIIIGVFFPLLYPNGKFLTKNWRNYFLVTIPITLFIIMILIFYPEIRNVGPIVPNPYARDFIANWNIPYILLASSMSIMSIPAFFSILHRFRTSDPETRQQIKWLIPMMVVFIIVPAAGSQENLFLDIIVVIGVTTLATSLAFGILRYRLWDIDLLINKSLVYGGLTALLVGFISGSLYLISQLFQNLSSGSTYALVFSALIFGTIFQPARYRLQRFVDRRLYDIEIDYQHAPKIKNQLPSTTTQTSLGEYTNLELIGEGGMAQVYKATHPNYENEIAIKILPERLAKEGDFTARFQQESQTITALNHPNIVNVFSYGTENGLSYMVMELLNGTDLHQHIKNRGSLTMQEAIPILTEIAAALDYAHGQGLVHRDIKPSNVMLDWPSEVNAEGTHPRTVLMDFGIAKILDKTAITKTGGLLGTFDYISPEQIQGAEHIDHRADIYSLGVMAFELVTGQLPFTHQNPAAILIAHLNQPPPHPQKVNSDIPLEVEEAILKAMAKSSTSRFNSAGDFAAALLG